MLKIVKYPNDPSYSLFVPFTRLWCAEPFLKSLETMILPRQSMEIIFLNDTNDDDLQLILSNWMNDHGQEFNGAKLYQSGKSYPGEFADVSYRRERICMMKEKSKELLSKTAFVFCLEDDTIAPPNAFSKLMENLTADDDIAVSSGVEVGRWTSPIIGAWMIEPLEHPNKITSIRYKKWGIREVDGCGWYCYVTYTSSYKAAHYRYEAESLGPDVVYAYDQRKAGYRVVIDWSIACTHLLENGKNIIPSEYTTVGIWYRESGENWRYESDPTPIKINISE
jgi:hypothetical protein